MEFKPGKIREYREAAGLTQHGLGKKLGLHPQSVGEWERGACGLTVRTLCKLCAALEKTPNDFFSECEPLEVPGGLQSWVERLNAGYRKLLMKEERK